MFIQIEDLAKADELARAGLLWYGVREGSYSSQTIPYDWSYKPNDTLPSECGRGFLFYILVED